MEAKGRQGNVPVNADVEAMKKKCEALETEVRSLKTFQSFMNRFVVIAWMQPFFAKLSSSARASWFDACRKDSEQTTKIEELEAKNASLTEERDKLLEELESIKGK